jgi:preprotein translocase subunit YajC
MFPLFVLLANGEQPAQPPGGGLLQMLMPIGLILVVGYFLLIRPMRRQEAERQAMMAGIKKNDKVLTIGGIYGTIAQVSDTEDEVVVKVDDNVRLRMTKSSIARNLSNEEAYKAQKEQKEQQKA